MVVNKTNALTDIYKDILILIFENENNRNYFHKYYNDNKYYQYMLRDFINLPPHERKLKIKRGIKENDN